MVWRSECAREQRERRLRSEALVRLCFVTRRWSLHRGGARPLKSGRSVVDVAVQVGPGTTEFSNLDFELSEVHGTLVVSAEHGSAPSVHNVTTVLAASHVLGDLLGAHHILPRSHHVAVDVSVGLPLRLQGSSHLFGCDDEFLSVIASVLFGPNCMRGSELYFSAQPV